MKAKTRNDKRTRPSQNNAPRSAANAQAPPRLLGLPRWVAILLTIAVVAGASYAVFSFILPGRIPPELVGKWRVTEGPWQGMTIEFRRDGSMIGKATIDGKDGVIEASAEVNGTTLRTTTTNPRTRKAETGTQTILSLTETELVTQDAAGTKVKMTRLP